MELLIAPILFIGVVLYVAYPLLWDEADAKPPPEAPRTDRQAILREKEDVVADLKDIEMDFRMGKLSSRDYEDLKSRIRGTGCRCLRAGRGAGAEEDPKDQGLTHPDGAADQPPHQAVRNLSGRLGPDLPGPKKANSSACSGLTAPARRPC